MITNKELIKRFTYDSDTGVMTRISDGKSLSSISVHGYSVAQIDKKKYRVHRLAWLYINGSFPDRDLDHINGIKTDNRICNLREVTVSENGKNAKTPSSNTSGRVGVCWHKQRGKWMAFINSEGKSHSLGLHIDYNDAVKAREEAEIKYEFHKNHGRVA